MIELLIIYFALVTLINIFFHLSNKQKDILFYSGLFILITLDGLRWETGTDWQNYHDAFLTNNKFIPGFEIGFNYYLNIVKTFTQNYSIFLVLTTTFIYIGIFKTIYDLTNKSFFSILILVSYLPWYSGALRQMMALVFFTIAIKYIFLRKRFIFYILIFIASTFHITAFPFIFLYSIYGLSTIGIFLILSLIFCFVAFFSSTFIMFNTLFSLVNENKTLDNRLVNNTENSNFILGLSRKIFNSGIPFFLYYKFLSKSQNLSIKTKLNLLFFLNTTLISIFFYIVGTFYIEHVSSRLDIYTGIVSYSILIGLIDKYAFKKEVKYILFFFVLLLITIYYFRLEYMDLFHPYKSIFYNKDFNRNLY